MAQNASTDRNGAMHKCPACELRLVVAPLAEMLGRIRNQHEPLPGAVWVMAARAVSITDRPMDEVRPGNRMASLAQSPGQLSQVKGMLLG
jgi:hypothetical protein